MRASGRDIAELFGYTPDDTTEKAVSQFRSQNCPFSKLLCSKTDHSASIRYGVCSVTLGANSSIGDDVIVCPERLYVNKYKILHDVAKQVWKKDSIPFVIGGSVDELRKKLLAHTEAVVAIGQRSGKEVAVPSAKLSMDWVLQNNSMEKGNITCNGFIGVEVQSIDITGNYREPWAAYREIKDGKTITEVPNSGHGLNWANVHKRLIPQIIRKGNLYSKCSSCHGFYFLTPEVVFQRFEEILGDVSTVDSPGRDNISIMTFSLEKNGQPGKIRKLINERTIHYRLKDIAEAFVSYTPKGAAEELETNVHRLFK